MAMASASSYKRSRSFLPAVLGSSSKWRRSVAMMRMALHLQHLSRFHHMHHCPFLRALFEKHFPEHAPAEFLQPDIDEKAHLTSQQQALGIEPMCAWSPTGRCHFLSSLGLGTLKNSLR
eukprot:6464244-Amphidinium_carterae.1